MSLTAFSGPVGTFTQQEDGVNHSNLGLVELSQVITLTHNTTNAVTGIAYLPLGAQITNFHIDNLTVWNSATSDTLSIGTAAAGTQYVASVNGQTAGRVAPTYTSAQVTAMSNIGTNIAVYATMTPVGTAAAGITLVTIIYRQNP